LRASGLVDLLAVYGTEQQRMNALRFDLALLPPRLRTLVRLFVLGDALPFGEIDSLLPWSWISSLTYLGIVREQGESIQLDDYRLVYHFGILVFCEKPDISATLYYGNDSLALGRLMMPARGRVLDVCAGVGTQGLLCALTAESVVSIERESRVVLPFAINAGLNRLEGKIHLRIGEFGEHLDGDTFDMICCNPPLLPVPDGLPFPIVGNGGPDGLGIAKTLLSLLPSLLRPRGLCRIVGTLVGDDRGPDTRAIQSLAEGGNLDVLLIVPCGEPLCPGSAMLDALASTASQYGDVGVDEAREAFCAHFASMAVDRLYSFLMVARHAGGRGLGHVELTRHYLRGSSFWTV